MASRRELDRLRRQMHKVELDREFASKHGYDAAYRRGTEKLRGLESTYRAKRSEG